MVLMALPYETATFLPLYVAKAEGMFAEEGLELDFVYSLSGGTRGGKRHKVEMAERGDVEFFTSVATSIEAVQQGWADVVAIAASAERPFYLLVRSRIRSVEELEGACVMTGGGSSRNEMLHLAQRMGWVVGRDLRLVRGDAVDRMKAFDDPSIDAVAGRIHYLSWAREAGFEPWRYRPGETWFEGGVVVTRSFAERRPDDVRALVRGLARGTEYVRNPSNRVMCTRILEQFVGHMNADDAERSYDVHREHYSLRLDPAGMEYMARVLATAKGGQVAEWSPTALDTRFIDELGNV